jgi:uncharacterized protein YdeI (YjbR/CyaY-like superfamily)
VATKKRAAEHVRQVYIPDRKAWRRWLSKNHDKESSIWLVYDKVGAKARRLTYDDIVEEALCFGWIDSLARSKDDKQAMLYLSARKKGGTWSALNKKRIPALIENGLMTEHGMRLIEEAKKDGSWAILDAIDRLEVPENLAAALKKRRGAKEGFETFSASTKKQLLYHIQSAKRPETRAKRIAQVVEGAAQRRNPLARRD